MEVTDEMRKAVLQWDSAADGCETTDWLIKRIIELHEANKPKPEPFVYYKKQPWGYDECDYDDEGSFPLYDAPPTREPLSNCELNEILDKLNRCDGNVWHIFDFARAIEQAHGIGTPQTTT